MPFCTNVINIFICTVPFLYFYGINSFHFSKPLFAIFRLMITTFYHVKGRRNTSIIFIPSYNQVMRKYVHFVTPKNNHVQRKSNFCVQFSTFYCCNFCCYLIIMPCAHIVSLWMLFISKNWHRYGVAFDLLKDTIQSILCIFECMYFSLIYVS